MADDEVKKRAAFLSDWVAKLCLMLLLPDASIKFVLDIEHNPSPEKFAQAEQFIRNTIDLLQKRAQQACQPSQPEPFVQSRTFIN